MEMFDVGTWAGKPELPEQIRKWFDQAKANRKEEERPTALQRARDTGTAVENHCIWIEAQDANGHSVDGARFKLLSEDSYEDRRENSKTGGCR